MKTLNLDIGQIVLYMLKNIETEEYIYDKDTKLFNLSNDLIDKHAIEAVIDGMHKMIFVSDWDCEIDKIALERF